MAQFLQRAIQHHALRFKQVPTIDLEIVLGWNSVKSTDAERFVCEVIIGYSSKPLERP